MRTEPVARATFAALLAVALPAIAAAAAPPPAQASFSAAPTWQRITFAPLPLPGPERVQLNLMLSQEVIVGEAGAQSYRPVGTGGKTEPSFLRFDLTWISPNDTQCQPVPLPAAIADVKEIHIALHRGARVDRLQQPIGWVGVGKSCGTSWFLTMYWPAEPADPGDTWLELQAAGRTYWVELPHGVARGTAAYPPAMGSLGDDDVLVPWAGVSYPLGGNGTLDVVNACYGLMRVTLNGRGPTTIESPSITLGIHRADGSVLQGREIARSIGPRQSVFDFPLHPSSSRTFDEVWVDVDGTRTIVTLPSSLYLLGLRLVDWGNPRLVRVPDATCKN